MGFVGKKNQEHSNRSSLYLTLSPLTLFDTRYSECGRVLSSLRSLESVDLESLRIHDVIPLFSYQKKTEYLKMQLLKQRSKFFPKTVILSGNIEFDNFIFETTKNEAEYLTGPERIKVSHVDCPEQLIRLREINLTDLKELSLTNCALSRGLFSKLIQESEYLPRLAELTLKDVSLDQYCFSIVCRLRLDSLFLENITLTDSKINLFALLCLESQFIPRLRRLTIRNNLAQRDLRILDEEFLTKWVTLVGDQPFTSVNLNKLNAKSALDSTHSTSLVKNSSTGKENKTSSTKKSQSKTSRKSGNKKQDRRTADARRKESLAQLVSDWLQRLARFGRNLEYLDLNENAIHDEGLQTILVKLASSKLQSLSLKNTQITSQSNR